MKLVCIALCPKCGRVWHASTKAVLKGEVFCRDGCTVPALVRVNP